MENSRLPARRVKEDLGDSVGAGVGAVGAGVGAGVVLH